MRDLLEGKNGQPTEGELQHPSSHDGTKEREKIVEQAPEIPKLDVQMVQRGEKEEREKAGRREARGGKKSIIGSMARGKGIPSVILNVFDAQPVRIVVLCPHELQSPTIVIKTHPKPS